MNEERLNKATPAKVKKWYHLPTTWRNGIAVAACLLFVGGLAGTSWYLEKHPRPMPAGEVAKVEPKCTYATTIDVKDASGKAVSHKTETRTAACTPKVYKPFVFPLWAKIIGYIVLALLVLCGGCQGLILFF